MVGVTGHELLVFKFLSYLLIASFEFSGFYNCVSQAPCVDFPIKLAFIVMFVKHKLVWHKRRHNVKRRSYPLHIREHQDAQISKVNDFISWHDVACVNSDKAGLYCSHGLKSSAFEFHDVAAMSCGAFSKYTNGIEVLAFVFNLFLTFHDCFDNLVSFFFCATTVNIDALLGFAKQTNESHMF